VTGATFTRVPGGKGANQAVAAARLGADVVMIACVGDDEFHRAAVVELQRAGVDMSRFKVVETATGVALITVDGDGENVIVVAPGANADLQPDDVELPDCDGVLCQLEIPLETVSHVARTAPGEFFLNAAPVTVSPGRGSRSVRATRSRLTEPTTVRRGAGATRRAYKEGRMRETVAR